MEGEGAAVGGTNSGESLSAALSAIVDNIGGIIDTSSGSSAHAYHRKPPQGNQSRSMRDHHQPSGGKPGDHHRLSYQHGGSSSFDFEGGSYVGMSHQSTLTNRLSPPPSQLALEGGVGEGLAGRTGKTGCSSDAKQLRKRSQAFEQLSAFLQ